MNNNNNAASFDSKYVLDNNYDHRGKISYNWTTQVLVGFINTQNETNGE